MIKFDDGVACARSWFDARDALIGNVLSIVDGLCEMDRLDHPEARWMCNVLRGVQTREEAIQIFLECGKDDPRALCFAALFMGPLLGGTALLEQSATRGYALAQAWMANETEGETCFDWAQRSALQGERNGIYVLAVCYSNGDGVAPDSELAATLYEKAAILGHVDAMSTFSFMVSDEVQKWYWLSQAASQGGVAIIEHFLSSIPQQVELFQAGEVNPSVMFFIGQALDGQVNEMEKTIFGFEVNMVTLFRAVLIAVDFFKRQSNSAKDAVNAWSLVALRLGFMKDLRVAVGRYIWETRFEAKYK